MTVRRVFFLCVLILASTSACGGPAAPVTPAAVDTPSPIATATFTLQPTDTPTPSPQPTETPTVTLTELPSPTSTDTSTPTQSPTMMPTRSHTPVPTHTGTPAPTPTPTETPIPSDTPTPVRPVDTPTPAPPTDTPIPTATPVPPPAQISIVKVDKEAEVVDIMNTGGLPQDLTGWMLVSERGNQCCTLGGIIGPGETLGIYALAEDVDKPGYNCGFGSPIWNNSKSDPAVLYNAQGQEVDRK